MVYWFSKKLGAAQEIPADGFERPDFLEETVMRVTEFGGHDSCIR
jgi:hypothetical protein